MSKTVAPLVSARQLVLLTPAGGEIERKYKRSVRWEDMEQGDSCSEFPNASLYPNKTVHVFGTFGGATVTMKGRGSQATGANALSMHNLGNPTAVAAFVAESAMELLENFPFIVPVISGGDGTTSLTVVVELAQ